MFNLRRSSGMFVLLCSTFFLFSWTAHAQGAEVYAGYQFTHLQPAFNASGWNAAVTKNFKHLLGITGDFSGAYRGDRSAHTYTGGPVLQARLPVVQPFFHLLVGGITMSDSAATSSSHSGFAWMLGGGLDIGWRKGIGIRLVQADWINTDVSDVNLRKNVRGSAGVVLKF